LQILNFDAFATIERQLKWKGVTHDVLDLSVEKFINGLVKEDQREKEDAAKQEGLSPLLQIKRQTEDAVQVVAEHIPTFPKEDLNKMKLDALNVLVQFIRGVLITDSAGGVIKPSEADQAAGDAAEKKPS
jgi:hypothetical protein